jgi:hypothetical protein
MGKVQRIQSMYFIFSTIFASNTFCSDNYLVSYVWHQLSWDSSVGIATDYWLDDWEVGVWAPVGQEFSLLHVIQICSGVHQTSYPPAVCLHLFSLSSLVDFLIFHFPLKMEAIRYSETSVNTTSTRYHIPEDCFLHSHRRENLKFYICLMILLLLLLLLLLLNWKNWIELLL